MTYRIFGKEHIEQGALTQMDNVPQAELDSFASLKSKLEEVQTQVSS